MSEILVAVGNQCKFGHTVKPTVIKENIQQRCPLFWLYFFHGNPTPLEHSLAHIGGCTPASSTCSMCGPWPSSMCSRFTLWSNTSWFVDAIPCPPVPAISKTDLQCLVTMIHNHNLRRKCLLRCAINCLACLSQKKIRFGQNDV